MNIEKFRDYCLQKKGVTEDFPFDEDTLVFKVLGKIFALFPLGNWETGKASINLKCDPDYAVELREQFNSIEPGFHMNKKHWNSLYVYKDELDLKLILELIDHSYSMVLKGLSKKQREKLSD